MRKVFYVLAVLVVASVVYITQRSVPELSNDQPQNTEASAAAPASDMGSEPETAQKDDLTGKWNKALDATTDALGKTADEAEQALSEALDATANALGRAKRALP